MQISRMLDRTHGVLRLRPTFVHRFYPDLARLGQSRLRRKATQYIPERWIGSSVEAVNPPPIPSGGLSMIHGTELSLRDAIAAEPRLLLGEELLAAHGPEYRVLVKLLDPGEPIVFHLHATDEQVRRMPRHFRGHRFGKDEAYYFLDQVPKGPMPYTHAGLYPGVTPRQLADAVRKGPQHALELSPVLYQTYETGFFMPAGLPHRPGTALTLEIQQPSDVYTLLETRSAGRTLPPQQIHPGFDSLEQALRLVDYERAYEVGKLKGYQLRPAVVKRTTAGEIAWVFPPKVCRKFAGQRLRIRTRVTHGYDHPVVMWVWKGQGTLQGMRIKPGDEFYIPPQAAAAGLDLRNAGDQVLEVFTFFPLVETSR